MKIIFVGGGTGGHIYPNIAIANELLNSCHSVLDTESKSLLRPGKISAGVYSALDAVTGMTNGASILFIISNSNLDKEILDKTVFQYKQISCGKLRRYFDFRNFIDPFKLIYGIFQSYFIIKEFQPDVIFCKGGYVSVPVAISAWFYNKIEKLKSGKVEKLKIILHESDMVMGLANKIVSKFADKIIWGIKEGMNPIRDKGQGTRDKEKNNSTLYPLPFTLYPVLLVMGGSQGAQQLNDLVVSIFPRIRDKYFVVHLTGKGKRTNIEDANYQQFEYLSEDYFNVLSLSYFVISRAGASSIAEILYFKKPSILIPLDSSSADHQRKNAKFVSDQGLAIYIDPVSLNSDNIINILNNENIIESLKNNLEKIENKNSSSEIAKIINSICS